MLDDEPSDAERELAPSPDVPDGSDAPRDLRRAFWSLVVTFNVALFALSLGLMLAYFRGQLALGGGLTLAGAALFARGYRRYQVYQDRDFGTDEA